MGGFQTGDDGDDVITWINVTPLVDIVLVLLIIFMVTTTYVVRSQINVDLPRAASGQSEVQKTLTFQVKKDGSYLLDNRAVTLEQVGREVQRKLADNPQLRAVIAADKHVEYQRVIDLIDTLKTNGLEKFALNIERKESESP